MFNSLWWVPIAAGLKDGINPCVLINASLIFLGLLWLKRNGYKRFWFILLIAVMLISALLYNCGFESKLILNKKFESIVKWVYVLFAVFVGFQGVEFLKQWFHLLKGKEIQLKKVEKRTKLSWIVLTLVIFLFGNLLSLLAALWPTNYYVSVLTVYMMAPGLFISMASFLALYTVISLWIVYLVIWSVSLENVNQRLFKIIGASILLSASLSVIDLFL